MSTDPTAGPPNPPSSGGGAGSTQGQPSEEDRSEIAQRAAYEAELSRITSADLMLQAAVSLLNVGSYRLAPRAAAPEAPGGQAPGAAGAGEASAPSASDLEQARDAIDGARALLEILERSIPSEIAPLRNALSQLQIAYARAVQAAGPAPAPPGGQGGSAPSSGGGTGGAPGGGEGSGEQQPDGPGPAESSGRLWVPGR